MIWTGGCAGETTASLFRTCLWSPRVKPAPCVPSHQQQLKEHSNSVRQHIHLGCGVVRPSHRDLRNPEAQPLDHKQSLNVEPKTVPADSRITVRSVRGDISVRSTDESQIRVDGKKSIQAWSETDAEHIASAVRRTVAVAAYSDVSATCSKA